MAVATVGGASAERVLVVEPQHHSRGGKHTLAPQRLLAGGSAVNQACRLLATGHSVQPIVPLCRDAFGAVVEAAMVDAAGRGGGRLHDEALFLSDGDATPFTTIVSVGAERTIYTEFSEDLFAPFDRHIESCLRGRSGRDTGALLVGHLHCDRSRPPGRAGEVSRRSVREARAAGIPVFVNPGSSQYRQGAATLLDVLDDVTCFQLDLEEMRAFVGGAGPRPRLVDILDWFRGKCTVVVTLERMGAVGQRVGSSRVVLTWPYEIQTVDTTGAGDAFAAGLVAGMLERPWDDDDAFAAAMARGGLYAAHACTTPGGADQCPTEGELEAFRAARGRVLDTEVTEVAQAGRLLQLLDRAFPPRGA